MPNSHKVTHRFSDIRSELAGGLISAAIAIPLAMGYGMFAFASLGEAYFADGAMAGLLTALVIAVVCVLAGERTTTVYAPRINSTFFLGLLIYGLVHSDAPAIAAGGAPVILAITFSVVLLGGALEALFGLMRLGTLIKFAPQPVMAGFQNAAALLLFLVQLGNVCGFDHTVPFTQVPEQLASAKPLSVIVAAITFLTMWNARKWLTKVPPIVVAIAVGSLLYYLGWILGLGSLLGPVIASGPRAPLGPTAFPYLFDWARSGDLAGFAPTVLGGALALAIIASIDALLCAKLVTAPGEPRPDGDRLLMRLGLGNVAAACAGGITGGLNIGASISNRSFGARTDLSVLVNAAAVLVAGVLLFRWLGGIPRAVLSAVIMVIAVQHFDLWSVRLARGLLSGRMSYRSHAAFDLAVVVLVAALSIALNIVLAVFIGVAIAVALFVVRMSRSVVRRSYRCDSIHSRKSRPAPERDLLDRVGDRILVVELQGALFFGTGERLVSELEGALARETTCVILDLRRLTEIDGTGTSILLELRSELARRKTQLRLAAGERTLAIERLGDFGALAAIDRADFFPDVDRAIERAEDDLLRCETQPESAEMELHEVALFATLGRSAIAAVEPYLRRIRYEPGSVVFREGDPGDELMIVIKGSASAYLHLPDGVDIRLATFAQGTIFGELPILDEGLRSATVVADGELICYTLTRAEFAALASKAPSIAIRLIAAVAGELGGRLRSANRTIYQLET
jgi:sulfate permease, SulP family